MLYSPPKGDQVFPSSVLEQDAKSLSCIPVVRIDMSEAKHIICHFNKVWRERNRRKQCLVMCSIGYCFPQSTHCWETLRSCCVARLHIRMVEDLGRGWHHMCERVYMLWPFGASYKDR